MKKVLAVVVAYQHPQALLDCLLSLSAQMYPEFRFVVWDNGGFNKMVAMKVEMFGTYHHSEENILWTPALNAAIEQYRQDDDDYLLTLNHDVVLHPGSVSDLVKAFDELPDHAGAVGPCGHGLGGQQGWGSYRSSLRERVNFLIGAAAMYKFEAYDKVGPFDNNMPLSGDDFDYAIRLKEAGYSLWVDETLAIHHKSHITHASENWNEPAKKSWEAFDAKYNGYYANETEATLGLWNGPYNPDYPVGTGISREEKIKRGIVRE